LMERYFELLEIKENYDWQKIIYLL
jgi:hypothetical protein